MLSPDFIGTIAATLTTLSFLPQAILVLRTRETRGISLGMYSVFTLGVALWIVYGVYLKATPVIAANIVTLCLALCILSVVIQNKLKSRG
ncbi:SemiSWEET transporter [Hellea balneolensis]|uniref:SemiSWEET transporter n=1 Tax=Hellea balneolensis TaxID=287478 RepID=UPI0003FF47EA|nr:SemiSWEET transporter [Hellea balneolensis]